MSWRRLLQGFAPLLVLGGLFLLDFPLCPSRWLFGAPCPGCGLTRATVALLTGDFSQAMVFHPLVPLLTPIVVWMVFRTALVSAGVLRSDSYDPLARLPKWFWVGVLLLLVGVWVARLLGALGGHPDPVDPANGLLGHVYRLVFGL